MREAPLRAAAILLLLGPALAGCRAPVREYRCAVSPAQAEVDPHGVWDCHRDIAARAAKRGKVTLREFRRASEFFEELTGIPADELPTDLGPLPGERMRDSLRRWDAWYAENGSRLYWDAAATRVAVRPAAGT